MKVKPSYHQERLWFIDKFEKGIIYPESPIYHNVPLLIKFYGSLAVDYLEESVSAIVNRHEALRTRLTTEEGQPMQILMEEMVSNVQRIDLTNNRDIHLTENIVELALKDSQKPFDLTKKSLLRIYLYQLPQNTWLLNLTFHHLIVDRRSLSIICEEILQFYQCKLNNQPISLPDLKFKYVDFSQWQHNLPDKTIEGLLFYWKRQFAKMPAPLRLPEDYLRPAIHTFTAARKCFTISTHLADRLVSYCKRDFEEVKLFLLGAFKILLSKYANQSEVNVGIIADNRLNNGLENIVGPLDNLVTIKSELTPGISFNEYINRLRKSVSDALKFKDIPFEKLVQLLNPPNDMSRTALFDVFFHAGQQFLRTPRFNRLNCEILETNLGWGKYDLNIFIDLTRGLHGFLVYNSDLFKSEKIKGFIKSYQETLQTLIDDPRQPVDQINILGKWMEKKILNTQERPFKEVLPKIPIYKLFEEQVLKSADATALITNENRISFQNLNQNSNLIANRLITEFKVKPGDFIGVILDRSEYMIYAILGILKAGAAYVPLDPNYPADRIRHILNDSGCLVIIAEKSSTKKVEIHSPALLVEVKELLDPDYVGEPESMDTGNSVDAAAYVIYTSGTTGKPKGCIISHFNLINLFRNSESPFEFNNQDVWILAHSYCFDFSVWEIFGALLNGGQLVIPDLETVKDSKNFLECVQRHKVTVLNQTPAAFYNFMEEAIMVEKKNLHHHLKYVIFGGDKLAPTRLKPWIEEYDLDKISLINMYGITETTVHVTYYKLKDIIDDLVVGSPIGKPLPGILLYILDKNMRPVPFGCNGEIYVGGLGVAKGYWRRDELNRERFIDSPFIEGDRLYRTGDVGRWSTGGKVIFVSRNDNQVKIRGHRIEKGEIEYAMRKLDYVKDVVVVMEVENDDSHLTAHVILTGHIESWKIARDLKSIIPEYMIPKFFIPLEAFPLTPNGKIDLKKLHRGLAASSNLSSSQYVPPRNLVEQELVDCWKKILNIDRVGIYDNFFELGGHSLKASRLLNFIGKRFGVKIDLKTFFTEPSIEILARSISSSADRSFQQIRPIEKQEYYHASNAQKRIWLANQFIEAGNEYNVPYTYKLKGVLHLERLERTISQLVKRHETLRTNYFLIDEELRQKIKTITSTRFNLYYDDLTLFDNPFERSVEKVKMLATTNFNLEKDTLIRVNLLKYDDDEYLLLINLHHAAADGWSMEILLYELHCIYLNLSTNDNFTLPGLPIQYKDFTAWHNHKLKSGYLEQLERFWKNKLNPVPGKLDLPFDKSMNNGAETIGKSAKLFLDKNSTDKLRLMTVEKGGSYFVYLLTAIKILISRYTGSEDISIISPVAGRGHQDLEQLVGFFSNTVIFRTLLSRYLKISEAFELVKANAMETFQHGDFPFDMAVNMFHRTNATANSMPFQIGYTWHSNHDLNNWSNINPQNTTFTIEPFSVQIDSAITDLWFHGFETHQGFGISIDYDSNKFKGSTIEKMLERLKRILITMVNNQELRIADIPLSEREEVLYKSSSFDLNI